MKKQIFPTVDAKIMDSEVSNNIGIEPVIVAAKQVEQKSNAPIKDKHNGKEEKAKKRDNRSIEQVLKSLSSYKTNEEKLSAVCEKYLDAMEENRKLQAGYKHAEKKVQVIEREKDQCQAEKSKALLAKNKLEVLCRELQRQNKLVKEESLLKLREEEERRKELSAKFQSTVAEVTTLMSDTNEKNVKLNQDNDNIQKQLKTVLHAMDKREKQYEGMHQVMKSELQLAEAKLAKVDIEVAQERDQFQKDKNTLLQKLAQYQTIVRELQGVEAELRSQVNMYTDKYEEFQKALSKSNEVFAGFNTEMEKMTKTIKKLEKEGSMWKSRCEKANATLIAMAEDKQSSDREVARLKRKCTVCQDLCRTLQTERKKLIFELKQKSGKECQDENEEENQDFKKNLLAVVEKSVENQLIDMLTLRDAINGEKTKESKTEPPVTICPREERLRNAELLKKQFEDSQLDAKKLEGETCSETVDNGVNQTFTETELTCPNLSKCIEQETSPVPAQENGSIKIETASNVEQSIESEQITSEENNININCVSKENELEPLVNNGDLVIQQGAIITEIEVDSTKENQNEIPKPEYTSISDLTTNKKNKDGKKKKK